MLISVGVCVSLCVYVCEQIRKNTYQILNISSGWKEGKLTLFLHIYLV